MTQMKTHKCPTCGTECKVVGIGDFNNKDEVCTQHYEPVVLSELDIKNIICDEDEKQAKINKSSASIEQIATAIYKAMRGENG